MAEVLKEIQSPLATELAEYILMRQDLQLASNTIKIWFTKYGDLDAITAAQDDLLIGQSLFRDAVVMVISCFDKSAPLRLFPEEIYGSFDGGMVVFLCIEVIGHAFVIIRF